MATYIYIALIVIFAGLAIYAFASRKKYNDNIEQRIKSLQEIHNKLLNEHDKLKFENSGLYSTSIGLGKEIEELEGRVDNLKTEKKNLDYDLISLREQNKMLQNEAQNWETKAAEAKASIAASQSAAKASAAAQEELTKKAFESYCATLESAYAKAEEEHDAAKAQLVDSIEQEQKKLKEISATRAAAHEALLKEQEIKENKDNYRLIPSQSDLEDIQALDRVKRTLHKPRILSMLVWQTYWQPLAKTRFPQILQAKTKMGIYKITNTQTNECYIGQSVDVYKRWNDHCKCGLGIDTPPGNKLYKAIQDYGLENFTFELLTECTKEELNSKEKYFIELYQAKDYGYNGNDGVR